MDTLRTWIALLQQEMTASHERCCPALSLPLLQEFFEHLQQRMPQLRNLSLVDVLLLQAFVDEVWQWCQQWQQCKPAEPPTTLQQLILQCGLVLIRWRRVAMRKDATVNGTDRLARTAALWIRTIPMAKVEAQMDRLLWLGEHDRSFQSIKPNSVVGNHIVDYFTFGERLKTRGKYNVSFVEFLARKEEFLQKPFVRNMLHHHMTQRNRRQRKHWLTLFNDVYSICLTAINIMKPINCMRLFVQYKARRVLNCCCGWGGSLVAAAALRLEAFYGIDINASLRDPYDNMLHYLRFKSPKTQMTCLLGVDACAFDYAGAGWVYDTVFCSPPYFFLEKYEHNISYASRQDMLQRFYWPLFQRSYAHLQPGGMFLINVCEEVVQAVLIPLLGPPWQVVPLRKAYRQNQHEEWVYVWQKQTAAALVDTS